MDTINKYIMYPYTKSLKEQKIFHSLQYDGTKESFQNVIQNAKKSVELKARDETENTLVILEYLEKNFQEYLLSEIKSIELCRIGHTLLHIDNTSKQLEETSVSIRIESSKTIVNEINNYTKGGSSNTFKYIFYMAFGLFMFMKFRN